MSVVSPQPLRRPAGSAAPPTAAEDRVFRRRLLGSVIALIAGGVLGLGAWLDPSPDGIGTHQQFNLPPCGWITLMDLPCPTCGMTTSVSHAAHGELWSSLRAQPLGLGVALAAGMCLIAGLYVAVSGSRLGSVLARLWGRRTGWFVAGLVLVAWGYKILHHKGLV